jgi:RNA polymerase sigma-70 factor (ECF subfamily)
VSDHHEAAAVRRAHAFEDVVLPELRVLLRVATSLTSQRADAEDLVQDTLLRAYRSLDRFDGRHPRAWLLTIMRRANSSNMRRHTALPVGDTDAIDRIARGSGEYDGPESQLFGGSFSEVVEAAFSSLPGKQQEIVRLVDVAELTYAEAAEVLSVPMGTVMSRLHRARGKIRRNLVSAGVIPRKAM